MSRGGKKKIARTYWGCTTFGCELGFDGTEEAMPEDVAVCPACGSELSTVTVMPRPKDAPLFADQDPPVPVGPTPEQLRRMRSEQLYQLCKGHIVEHYPSLWPGQVRGAAIAEQWIQNVLARLVQQRAAAQLVHVENADLAAATGRLLPS